jgi:colicin import membrane protein
MPIPVATALGKRDRLWPAVAVSLLVHAVLAGWAVARRPPAPIDLDQKPIVAKLVRLGEKRPEQWLPRKEAAPPPPAPAPAAPAAPVLAAPAKPAAPAADAKAPPKPAAPSPSARGSGTTLASVLSKVQRDVDESRWGDPEGDPSGDSETGTEGDRYLALVYRELQANYNLPVTMSRSEAAGLGALVVLVIDPSGRVLRYSFERRSGNAAYDAALERAIEASRLPPPPPELRERFRRGGLAIHFHV